MGIVTEYNKVFDYRRIAKLDREIAKCGEKRREWQKKALDLVHQREKLLGQKPTATPLILQKKKKPRPPNPRA